jgi:hypothetical protein
MERLHVFSLGFLLALIIGYFVGVKYPRMGNKVFGSL